MEVILFIVLIILIRFLLRKIIFNEKLKEDKLIIDSITGFMVFLCIAYILCKILYNPPPMSYS